MMKSQSLWIVHSVDELYKMGIVVVVCTSDNLYYI